jgi:glycosyltransferase involved in cell wall biosynthesis
MHLMVNGLAARTGGGITYLGSLLRAAVEADDELEITLLVTEPALFAQLDDVTRIRLSTPFRRRPSVFARIAWETLMLARHARRAGADVLFCPSEVGPAWSGVPVVLGFQNPNLWERPLPIRASVRARMLALRFLARQAARNAKALVFVSDHLRDVAALPASFARREVLSPPIDPSFAAVDPSASRFAQLRPYILTVGDVYPYKNLGQLIEAFALLRASRPELRLVIAGEPVDADEARELKERSARLGVEAGVVLVGSVPLQQMPELYSGASCFAFASLLESFGFPPLEAMACGIPVVCSRTSVMPSVLGDAPEWFEAGDAAGAARTIQLLLDDPALAAKAIDRGLIQARRYGIEAAGEAAARIFHRASQPS